MSRAGNADRAATTVPDRAEEIIAAVYARIAALRTDGRTPTAIVLPTAQYRTLQRYRSRLGDVPEGRVDYLGRYQLFGLPILCDGGSRIVISTRPIA